MTLAEIQQIIEQEIKQLKWENEPNGLYQPIEYILSLGGKRVRPALTLMATDMFGGNIREAMPATLALEIFHNFTLLHDDVMDKADVRRGQPTVHKKWNENTAILSGDQMLIESYKMLGRTTPALFNQVFPLFSQMGTEICEGQQYDMEFEKRNDVTINEYINMIRLKTAVLLGTALRIGSLVAQAPEADQIELYNFGINIGLAFQLKDDYLDVYGDEKTFGKAIGGDILCNKKTYMLITAFQEASSGARQELEHLMKPNTCSPLEKIAAVTNLYNSLGVNTKCEQAINHYHQAALANLERIQLPEDRKQNLCLLAEKLMNRQD